MKYIDIYTPDSVIAAAVVYGSEDPREVAYNDAAYALDRDDIHLITSVEAGKVYYIAAASNEFSGHNDAVTPLAAALPGLKGHQGDGAYVTVSESGYAVVIKKNDELFSYVGDRQSIDAFIASHEVPTFTSNDAAALPWEGYNLGNLKRANRITQVATWTGSGLALFSFVLWLIFTIMVGGTEDREMELRGESRERAQAVIKKLEDSIKTKPVLEDLKKMQEITALTVSTGGWVDFITIEKGRLRWRVELPSWVQSDYLRQFGRNLEVNLLTEVDRIEVSYNLDEKERKKRR